MKRISRYHLMTVACFLFLVVMPIAASAVDSATINSTTTPSCLTPGQKVNVTLNVTNTGTETWHTAATCPTGTPHDPIPGMVNDCRHSITYWVDGVYKGDVTNLTANVNPGGNPTLSASFCASDTTATRDCDGSNPPLSLGSHTVEWFVLHQYIGKVQTGKTATFQVKSSCSPFTCADGSVGWACFCKKYHPICEPQYELPRIKKPWPPEWLKLREEILDIRTKFLRSSPSQKKLLEDKAFNLEQTNLKMLQDVSRELKLKGSELQKPKLDQMQRKQIGQ